MPDAEPVDQALFHSHREQMRANLLASDPETVDDEDLLEMLLFLSISRRETKPLARAIIEDCGDFYRSCQADPAELRRLGLGDSSIDIIALVREAARRLNLAKRASRPLIATEADLTDYLDIPARLRLPAHTAALLLDNQNLLLADLSFPTSLPPEDIVNTVVRRALEGDAVTLIMATIRPGGDPFDPDRESALGARAAKLARALSITFRNHFIFSAGGKISSMHLGLI
jgi:DNA repair protein RadC